MQQTEFKPKLSRWVNIKPAFDFYNISIIIINDNYLNACILYEVPLSHTYNARASIFPKLPLPFSAAP